MSKTPEDTSARKVRPGACSWCGHDPHAGACTQSIRIEKATTAPCPCSRRTEGTD